MRLHNKIKQFLSQALHPVLIILGPTASGKSALAVSLAKKYNGEIISADSRQIYKYMNIGTAKTPVKERGGIPHHLLSIIPPDQNFSVAEYRKQALKAISKIRKKKKLPIVEGGTGLYIDALIYNFQMPPRSPKSLRDKLTAIYQKKSGEYLHRILEKKDPLAAAKIHPNNKHHLIRALEVVLNTGQSKFQMAKKEKPSFNVLFLGLSLPREELYRRIDERVIKMFDQGLLKEIKKILRMGFFPNLPALSSIGYREAILILQNKMSLKKAISLIQQKTRNYAKRQMTWFKRNKEIFWYKTDQSAH